MKEKNVITGKKIKIFICLALLMTLWLGNDARGEDKNKTVMDRKQPIQIVSDRLDAYHEKHMIVFTGNAVATQGKRTIRADRLTLYYRDDKDKDKKTEERGKSEMEGVGGLDRVEAKGNVTITEDNRIVTGDEAIFEQDAQKVTMTGNAVMHEGANIIRGERIVVFLNENRGMVDSSDTKRVTATIYPEETKGKKP